jgi:hypothetical protein
MAFDTEVHRRRCGLITIADVTLEEKYANTLAKNAFVAAKHAEASLLSAQPVAA